MRPGGSRRLAKWVAGLAICLFAMKATAAESPGQAASPQFELRPGDRVVLLGGGLIEQERRYGYLEMRLSRRVPEGSLSFRNLGWAGDTVRGIARTSGFQNPEGFARLLKEVSDYKPTVLFIGYGTNESFDGLKGLAGFRDDYAKLLAKLAPLKARIVLISPPYQEDLGRPFPDPTKHRRDFDAYRAATAQLALEHKLALVDLAPRMADVKSARPPKQLTTNGLQLNEAGSAVAAQIIEILLDLPAPTWRAELDAAGKVLVSEATRIHDIVATKDGIRFRATDDMLAALREPRDLKVAALPPGVYALKLNGEELFRVSAVDWQRGISYASDAFVVDAENLRRAIVANNDLFYRRWRPFNDHSRHWGFIGGDGKLYDQEMAAQEKIIAKLRRPRAYQYEVARIDEGK